MTSAFDISAEQNNLENFLLSLNRIGASDLLKGLITSVNPSDIADLLLSPVLERIGSRWERGEIALSQVYMSGRICDEITRSLFPRPKIIDSSTDIAITVLDDYHVLGKQLVVMLLSTAGIPIRDYGTCSVGQIVKRTVEDRLSVLLISTLMLHSALHVREVVKELRVKSPKTAIIVGGAPFRLDPLLGNEVGADASGSTAADAIRLVHDYRKGRVQ